MNIDIINQVRNLKKDEIFLVEKKNNKGSLINIALVYPSPYYIAMSSLGYQTVYKIFNSIENVNCERSFLPDKTSIYWSKRNKIFSFESEEYINKFDIVAFSISYEIEILGLIECLELSNINPLSRNRSSRYDPLVIAGGPLTFSNPLPLGPFVDIVILGEAEEIIPIFIEHYKNYNDKNKLLKKLSELPGFYIPSIHLDYFFSSIITPNTELSNMFLIEPERGCSRGCSFCVMRRSTNNGMRLVSIDKVIEKIPDFVEKVGLVGAAVSDHPKITDILEELVVNRNKKIGISSLRADRLNDKFVNLLVKGGYKTLTVASDGASQRIRNFMEKRIKEEHIIKAAELSKYYGIKTFKIYMMIGVPNETDDDIDELISFSIKISKIINTAITISPFVSKKNTPLDKLPFEDIKSIDNKIKKINKELGKYVDVRNSSAKWAYVEYKLAQGTYSTGFCALSAYNNGGNFSAWKNAFENENNIKIS